MYQWQQELKMQQSEYQKEIIYDATPVYRPKHQILAKITGIIAEIVDRILWVFLGIIIGASAVIILTFVIE
jgi:hypothetical protein